MSRPRLTVEPATARVAFAVDAEVAAVLESHAGERSAAAIGRNAVRVVLGLPPLPVPASPSEDPKLLNLVVRLAPSEHAAAKLAAQRERLSVPQFARRALLIYVRGTTAAAVRCPDSAPGRSWGGGAGGRRPAVPGTTANVIARTMLPPALAARLAAARGDVALGSFVRDAVRRRLGLAPVDPATFRRRATHGLRVPARRRTTAVGLAAAEHAAATRAAGGRAALGAWMRGAVVARLDELAAEAA